MKHCTTENCDKPQHGKGLCSYHYQKATRTPTYQAFHQSKNRCLNPNNQRYKDYGGRGIKMCDRWAGADGYKNFIDDMGERPKGMTLDRIDNEKGYSPDNCRWATYETQNLNKRIYKNNRTGVVGVSYHRSSKLWIAHIRVRGIGKTEYYRTKAEAVHARMRAELDRKVQIVI